MERVHNFLRHQAIKLGVLGTVVAAVLLIFGPLLDLLFPQHPDIVMSVSIGILTGVGLLLLDYLSEVKRLIKPAEIHLYPNQGVADKHLRALIESERPAKADLLAIVSNNLYQNIIEPLVIVGSDIRLLMLNPKVAGRVFAPSNRQERRICNQIALQLGTEPQVALYGKIRIRFYQELPSLRGLMFGNRLVSVGWYTYDLRPDEMDVSTDPVQIWGHNNPLISIAASEKDFDIVEGLFRRVFENFWSRAVSPKDICNACSEKQSHRCPVTDAWLDLVSRA